MNALHAVEYTMLYHCSDSLTDHESLLEFWKLAVVRLENGYPATRSEEASFRELERKKDEVLRGQPEQDD